LDTNYFNHYDTVVQYALNKGATVIIDPHNYARYNDAIIGASGSGVTNANFIDMWQKMAQKYKSRADLVVFGLVNEPHGMSSNTWFATAQATINALREAGVTNTILVPGNAYTGAHSWVDTYAGYSTDTPIVSNAVHAAAITDPLNNMAFEVHQYFDSQYGGLSEVCTTGRTATSILGDFEEFLINNNAYGYLGEYAGAANSDCETIVKDVLDHIKNNPRWLGSSWWAGGPWWGNYMFTLETSDLTGNVTQMNWLNGRVIPYERYAGYDPSGSTSPSTPSAVFTPSGGGSAPSGSSTPSEGGSTPSGGGSTPSDENPTGSGTPNFPVGTPNLNADDPVPTPINHGNALAISWALLSLVLVMISSF
jgi:hypothetical protein